MAQFRGTVEGNRSQVSRLGHKTSGLATECNAWDVGVSCFADHKDGKDVINITITGGSNRAGLTQILGWVDSEGNICVNHELDNVTTPADLKKRVA